jgi:valyl-tRNA synthetase
VIIERSKKKILESNSAASAEASARQASAKYVLYLQLTTLLKILHPFMPFITEEIWSVLPSATDTKKLLIIESWPA